MPVFYSNTESYEIIKKSYTSPNFGKFQITNNTNYYTLFHFLYLDIFANETCYKQKSVSLDSIFEEYEKIIENSPNDELKQIFSVLTNLIDSSDVGLRKSVKNLLKEFLNLNLVIFNKYN